MNKTILTTVAALLVSAGSAFAIGSDNYGSNYQPGVAIDQGTTASISQTDSALKTLLSSDVKVQDSDRSVWGR